ncbi:MAG: hypothetical protein ACOX4T_10915 [Acetivibrionales bacterium]
MMVILYHCKITGGDNFNEANQNWLGEGILDIGGAKPFVPAASLAPGRSP